MLIGCTTGVLCIFSSFSLPFSCHVSLCTLSAFLVWTFPCFINLLPYEVFLSATCFIHYHMTSTITQWLTSFPCSIYCQNACFRQVPQFFLSYKSPNLFCTDWFMHISQNYLYQIFNITSSFSVMDNVDIFNKLWLLNTDKKALYWSHGQTCHG